MVNLKKFFFLTCWLTALLSSAASAANLRTVALTGTQAPGTPDGVTFSQLIFTGDAILNAAGQLAFEGRLAGDGVDSTNDAGIWSENSGSLRLVALKGNPVPGPPSEKRFLRFVDVVINSAGQTAFTASVITGNDFSRIVQSVWSEGSGSLSLVALAGDQAPGASLGVTFNSFSMPVLNSAGAIAFAAELNDVDRRGIWLQNSGSLSLVAREGSQAPGVEAGLNFGFGSFSDLSLDSAGRTLFRSRLLEVGVGFGGEGVWLGNLGSLGLVARRDDPASDLPPGTTFGAFHTVRSNQAGQLVLVGGLAGSNVDSSNNFGLWSGDSNSLRLVIRKGDPAPGLPDGVDFRPMTLGVEGEVLGPVISSDGKIAFAGNLVGNGVDPTNDRAIWAEDSGSLRLVARTGNLAPDVPDGVSFDALLGVIALNSAGQAAFRGVLTGDGIDSTNDQGIWAEDRLGRIRLIVREGDALELDPGDSRTISSFQSVGFDNLGQLAFSALFDDGSSGIFVSNLATIPEPSTLAAIGMALGVTALRRRRHRQSFGVEVATVIDNLP